jgi:hypothetical protein
MPDAEAAALHVASGLEWLVARGGIRAFPPGEDTPGWYLDDNGQPPRWWVRAPTLLHAIAAAIAALAAKEADHE